MGWRLAPRGHQFGSFRLGNDLALHWARGRLLCLTLVVCRGLSARLLVLAEPREQEGRGPQQERREEQNELLALVQQ